MSWKVFKILSQDCVNYCLGLTLILVTARSNLLSGIITVELQCSNTDGSFTTAVSNSFSSP